MKPCFKITCTKNNGEQEIIPMRGKDAQDARQKIRRQHQHTFVGEPVRIEYDEFLAMKGKAQPAPVESDAPEHPERPLNRGPRVVRPLTPAVSGERPFAGLKFGK